MSQPLLVPGLFWPHRDAPPGFDRLTLPALAWLLARTRFAALPPQASSTAFAAALGLPECGDAVLRRAGEQGLPLPQAGERWLCADPANLRFARDQMLLTDATTLDLSEPERSAIEALLRETLAPYGDFCLPHPQRGYLRLREASGAVFSALEDVNGRPVALFLPEGEGARHWGRVVNEVQIALHELPVNAARRTDRQAEANTLWFWGEGVVPDSPSTPPPVVCTDTIAGQGTACLAGTTARSLEAFAQEESAAVLCERLVRAAVLGDAAAWLEALRTLETALFAPLARRLRSGHQASAEIDVPDRHRPGRRLLIPARRWAFWLRPAPLSVLLDPATP